MTNETDRSQRIVVLGGGSDIGREILIGLAKQRPSYVLLIGRNSSSLQRTSDALRDVGVENIELMIADLSDATQAQACVERSLASLSQIDLLLVAVGALGIANLDELDAMATTSLINTNFAGPAGWMLEFANAMRHHGSGKIVVLSSVAGYRVRKANFVYGSAKAGLDAFAQGLSHALDGSGVSVMIVRPGYVRTKMTSHLTEMPFATDADAVASATLQGLASGAQFVWSPPYLRHIFRAFRLIPDKIWRRLPN